MNDDRQRNARDVPWRMPGVGHGINALICSRCNLHKPAKGGGTIRGRWYGACCKPTKGVAK